MALSLRHVATLVAPVALAGERLLPVLPALEPLLPAAGLRRGSVVAVAGSASLALAMVAAATAEGSWGAAVGMPTLGPVAAAELGIVLDRFPLVPRTEAGGPGGWPAVVAALLDALDVVVARPDRSVRPDDARRLAARARERGSVLVVVGGATEGAAGRAAGGAAWPAADVRLTVARAEWVGLGGGWGRLRGRRLEVVAGGRGSAARERRVALWLHHPDGVVAPAEPVPAVARPAGVEERPA